MDSSLGFLFCSTDVYFCLCASTILSYDCGFVVEPEVSPFFFLKIALGIRGFLYFHINCEIICSGSMKNTIGSFIEIALNL